MSWTGIIFRLLAWVRPVLWYYHALRRLLATMLLVWEDDECLCWMADNPYGRADFESKLADAEQCLDIIIGLRAREILGLPVTPEIRPGVGIGARIHSAPSLEHLAARLGRLIERYQGVERLARLRAARLRREKDAAPVLLMADHQPLFCLPSMMMIASSSFSAIISAFQSHTAGLRIRAPP